MNPLHSRLILIGLLISSGSLASPVQYTLEDLLNRSLSRNETYLISQESLTQSQEVLRRARGTFLPTLNVLGTYFRQETPESDIGQRVSPTIQRNWRLTANQPLFQGGSEYAALAQTKRSVEAAESAVRAARSQLLLELTDLYFEVLLRQSTLKRNQNEVRLYADQIRELRSRVRVGRSRASDLLTVEAAAAQLEATLKTTESELFRFKTLLASLSGVEGEFELKEMNSSANESVRPLDVYLASISDSPTIQSALKQREATQESIALARGRHFPALGVSANYYLKREGLNRETDWDVLTTLTIPIFNGGRTQSEVREASSRYRVAELEAERRLREIRSEVISLHQSVAAADAELKALQNARDLADQSRERIARDFRFGLSNNLELVQAMRTLEESETLLDRVRLNRMKDRLRLDVISGQKIP